MEIIPRINVIDETWNDPAPGEDPSWDTLSDCEKAILRQPQRQSGKFLGDLLRDQGAIDGEFSVVHNVKVTGAPAYGD